VTSLLIADTSRGSVLAESEDVLGSGVEVGMSLYRARQRAPFAQVVEADEDAYHVPHDAAFAVLGDFSDRIETVALGEFLLEWRGNTDFVQGGYDTQVETLARELRAVSELEVQVGVAAHRFTAQQAARRVTDDGICVIRSERDARFLSQLPVTILPNIPDDMTARLWAFGIHTLGQFAALPRAAFARQFGSALALLHDLARGRGGVIHVHCALMSLLCALCANGGLMSRWSASVWLSALHGTSRKPSAVRLRSRGIRRNRSSSR
jgi:nucleotidyltransferase/DNA polymerase involved in DNA repair